MCNNKCDEFCQAGSLVGGSAAEPGVGIAGVDVVGTWGVAVEGVATEAEDVDTWVTAVVAAPLDV